MSSEKIASTDVELIKKLIDMMSSNDLVEIELSDETTKIHLRRPEPKHLEQVISHMPAMTAPMPVAAATQSFAAAQTPPACEEGVAIESPIVGTFYTAPSPEAAPFVKVGDTVTEDTVVCIIEAMKVMNEIKAETNGTITEMCVSNGQAVEFGQPLFKVKS
jgi:acetyl-CoA carboxylase biotin carboxyl carrier protein